MHTNIPTAKDQAVLQDIQRQAGVTPGYLPSCKKSNGDELSKRTQRGGATHPSQQQPRAAKKDSL